MSSGDRSALAAELSEVLREAASRSLMLHQAIAGRFRLNPTDLKCLDLVRGQESLTAGDLARASGMSTSAITTALDRLERAGVIERGRDTADRRKVVVRLTGRHDAELGGIFSELDRRIAAVLEDYDEDQLKVITGFHRRVNAETHDLTRSLAVAVDPVR